MYKCEGHTCDRDGRIICVIDTPGLFEPSARSKPTVNQIMKWVDFARDGISALLLVLSVKNRFSKEEVDSLHFLEGLFGDNLFNYMIFVFTGGDELEHKYMSLDNYLASPLCPKSLQKIVERCGKRKVVFDNKTLDGNKKRKQVGTLLSLVDGVMKQNGGKTYKEIPNQQIRKYFFDMEIEGKLAGRIIMELCADTTLRTAENFRALCNGEKGVGIYGIPLHFKGSKFFNIVPDFMCSGGFLTDGTEKVIDSIYGPNFAAENFIKKHISPGSLSMYTFEKLKSRSKLTLGSIFTIWNVEACWIDKIDFVFVHVIDGMQVIRNIERGLGSYPTNMSVVIADCGQLS